MVHRYAGGPEQAERILANPFYRNLADALSGTQEYMAAEKLYELHHDDRFDLVVIDTPPTRNALDFLDAPGRLTRFLDHRLYRALMLPTKLGLRVVNAAAQAMLRTISKVVGGAVIADVIAFFDAFDGMEAGFKERAVAVEALLSNPDTNYVVVTSPRRAAVDEAAYFAERLAEHHLSVSAVIVNRRHPRFGSMTSSEVARRAAAAEADRAPDAGLWANLDELTRVAEDEDAVVAPIVGRAAEDDDRIPVVSVPLLVDDVHDLDGLATVAGHLFASARRRG
ncbi:MAG: ArsA-related P-loop ATPase [Ilumatobacteraceae bacterium]